MRRQSSPALASPALAFIALALIALAVLTAATGSLAARAQETRFRGGVELVNVTATVSDGDGRFVAGLQKEDFRVYENGARQEVSIFSRDRLPVSLGIVLDTSGSMTADKMAAAQSAIDRFTSDLLDKDDELFFVEFANSARITQDWTKDRQAISRAVAGVVAAGGTAMYDAVAHAVPVAAIGQHRKKALLLISDGNDTNSRRSAEEVRALIRESEVLVYALGVDSRPQPDERVRNPPVRLPVPPIQIPFPIPGGRRPQPRIPPPILGSGTFRRNSAERVNQDALRAITDDTGGRTEIVKGFGELGEATARLANELSQQYYLGYSSTEPKDGRWHSIRVEVRNRRANVRARRGFVAS